jgi:FkbM family methyltransferase
MSIINGALKRIFFGKKAFQPFFNRLLVLSLEGLNVGSGGGDLLQNGEAFAIEYCLKEATNPIVFDVGAQGGGYTKEILRVSRGKANVHSFEPAKKPYEELVTQFGQKATIVKFALGEQAGEAILFSPKNGDGLSSLYQHDDRFTLTEKVPVTTIDTYCSSNKISRITLLKLDVEGHELACLRGARLMLAHIDHIQFEMSIASRDARTYFKDMFEFLSDYTIYRILKDGLVEIKKPDKIAELLFTTNYLAVRKDGQ